MAKELLFKQDYVVAEHEVNFFLYREELEDEIKVSLSFEIPGEMPEVDFKIFHYPKIAESFRSEYLSWYNLICCSNYYGPVPVVDYMNYSVQNKKKIAATIYPKDAEEYKKIIIESTDLNVLPFNEAEYAYELYICRLGKLSDFFSMDEVVKVYSESGIYLDREVLEKFFDENLNWFGNYDDCSFDINNPQTDEEWVVTGLLFGYPVESTVAMLLGKIEGTA